jgi:hypothetical protein
MTVVPFDKPTPKTCPDPFDDFHRSSYSTLHRNAERRVYQVSGDRDAGLDPLCFFSFLVFAGLSSPCIDCAAFLGLGLSTDQRKGLGGSITGSRLVALCRVNAAVNLSLLACSDICHGRQLTMIGQKQHMLSKNAHLLKCPSQLAAAGGAGSGRFFAEQVVSVIGLEWKEFLHACSGLFFGEFSGGFPGVRLVEQ